MDEQPFEIDINAPKKDFEAHLALLDNRRVFFSAPFGSGKTFFLKRYFADGPYEAIHLFPVNYSTTSNKDIFELIKYDILFELLAKGLAIDTFEFSKLFTLEYFLSKNSFRLFKVIGENTTTIGKNLSLIAQPLEKLYREYVNFHKDSSANEQDKIIAYLKSFSTKKGSLYEEDSYTQLISHLVNQLKALGRQAILIIDDLDRIEPKHIFRLLNVFAAHFDIGANTNKFGFDKIIFVGDVFNIRKIFQTQYGLDVDFIGYIDKFYSKEIFYFDNKKMIEDNIEAILLSISVAQTYSTQLKIRES